MPRWEPDAVGRLQAAALELFAEQGYERTTVAEITERAGLTKRTFFNHFADKREVLFSPLSAIQRQTVTREIAASPGTLPPLEAVVRGLRAAADAVFEERRATVTCREEIVAATPELRERELSKQADLTDAIAGALRARGTDPDTASLSASAGVLIQRTAMRSWTRSAGDRPLRDFLSDALLRLRKVAGAGQCD